MFSPLAVKHISGISGRVFWPLLEGGMAEEPSPRAAWGASFSVCRDCRKGRFQQRGQPGAGGASSPSSPLLGHLWLPHHKFSLTPSQPAALLQKPPERSSRQSDCVPPTHKLSHLELRPDQHRRHPTVLDRLASTALGLLCSSHRGLLAVPPQHPKCQAGSCPSAFARAIPTAWGAHLSLT